MVAPGIKSPPHWGNENGRKKAMIIREELILGKNKLEKRLGNIWTLGVGHAGLLGICKHCGMPEDRADRVTRGGGIKRVGGGGPMGINIRSKNLVALGISNHGLVILENPPLGDRNPINKKKGNDN